MNRSVEDVKADLQAQAQEVYALEQIYGKENIKSHHDGYNLNVELYVPSVDGPHTTLKVTIPNTYPSSSPPLGKVSAPFLSDDTMEWANRELQKLYRPGEKENILFTWIEWIKDQPEMQPPQRPSPKIDDRDYMQGLASQYMDLGEMDLDNFRKLYLGKQSGEAGDGSKTQTDCNLDGISIQVRVRPDAMFKHGEPLTEKKSTFQRENYIQAHLAPVKTVAEVKRLMDSLLLDKKVQKATHNIMAYRIQASAAVYLQDCDDDGESAAGARLLHLLQMADVRNVLVVVSRWYGGIQLGPARFTHINNAARTLLTEQGYIKSSTGKSGQKGK